ncbi:haloacid dehalogenase [Panus rudis PR-1116 ss-1]|nr:haloacid dehalogenase [Panus rudis PR-1116 ss-1]
MAEARKTQYLAFDIYGTLLNTTSIASVIKTVLPIDEEKASALSSRWRTYQLEYTWRLNSMGLYEPFDIVTKKSFLHAASEMGLKVNERQAVDILEGYNHLAPYDDALEVLRQLTEVPSVKAFIFSNGTHEMVSTALTTDYLASIPLKIYVADSVRQYKPSQVIYKGLLSFIKESEEAASISAEDVWLVSGNPFDVTGARNMGLNAFWVDRSNTGWHDKVAPDGLDLAPTKIVRNLQEVAEFMRQAGNV